MNTDKTKLKDSSLPITENAVKKIADFNKSRKRPTVPASESDQSMIKRVSHSISIAEAMNECLWLGDKNHKTIYVNPVYEKTSGYSLAECIGKPADFCFDEESKKTISNHHKLRSHGIASQYEATMVSKSGKKTPLLISGAPTVEGGTIGIFINLTKIKNLMEKEKLSEQIVKNTSDAIVMLDKNRKIKMWSNGARKVFGWKEKDVLEKSINLIIPKEEEKSNMGLIRYVNKKKYLKNHETKRLHKSGKLIDVSVSITKVTDESRHFIGYLIMYRDITSQKKINSELQKRFEAVQDAYKELGLQKRQSDYLKEILNIGASDSNLDNLCKVIVSGACMLTKCDGATLRIYNKERDALELTACIGVNQKWLDKKYIDYKNSIAKEAFENRRPLILHDVQNSEKHKGTTLLNEHNFRTLIMVPLFIDGEILGTLSLYATDPAKFRLIETEFLEDYGKQVSLALYVKIYKEKELLQKSN